MVDFKNLTDQAKKVIDERGGMDSVEQDAAELRNIAGGQGTASDKLKAAAEALREPGSAPAGGEQSAAGGVGSRVPGAPDVAPSDADDASRAEGVASKIPGAPDVSTSDPAQRETAEGVADKIPGAPRER